MATKLQPLERARVAVRLLLVELMDELVPAGDLRSYAQSVQRSLREYEIGIEGSDEEIDPRKSPQRELSDYAQVLVEILFTPGEEEEPGWKRGSRGETSVAGSRSFEDE